MLPELAQQIFLGLLVITVFLAFVKEWVSVEIVAIGALFVCMAFGILPISTNDPELMRFNGLGVFGHPAPITVACMFILSAALDRTGVIDILGEWFEENAATSQIKLLVILILVVALLSGFMNNTPVVVVFMPIVMRICRNKDWKASKFLIPLSYAAIVGGTVTIIGTSTNLLASGIAEQQGMKPFTMFEISKLGIIFVVITFVYLLTLGRKLVPERVTLASLIDTESSREFITHAFIGEDSELVGEKLTDTPLGKMKKARIIEIRRDGLRVRTPLSELVFEKGDELVFKGDLTALMGVTHTDGIDIRGEKELGLEGLRTESAILMEGIIGQDSALVGKSLKELQFRQRYGVLILAVHRRGKNLRDRFEDEKLAFGDTLLVQGPREKMKRLFEMKDFINLSQTKVNAQPRPKKAPIAVGALLLFILLGALGGFGVIPPIPVVTVAMGASLIVLVTGCLTPKEAYDAIEWKVLFLIFGMLGLGLAIEKSGLAANLASAVTGLLEGVDDRIVIAVFYLMAAIMTEIISNNAVAALLTPLAIFVGQQMGFDPRGLVIAVMFGSSASFLTPIGYQTNTFVYGAGGYHFKDFFRVGAPLSFILWIIASYLIPLWWPLAS